MPTKNTELTKLITKYFSDFLETDFKTERLPKRNSMSFVQKWEKIAIDIEKYDNLKTDWYRTFFTTSEENFIVKKNIYSATIDAKLQWLLEKQIEDISIHELDNLCETIHSILSEKRDEYKIEKDSKGFYRDGPKFVQEVIENNFVNPFLEISAKSFLNSNIDNQSYLLVHSIYELLQEDMERVLREYYLEKDKNPDDEKYFNALEFFKTRLHKHNIKSVLKSYFKDTTITDAFADISDIIETRKRIPQTDLYLYFYEIETKIEGNLYRFPLFYNKIDVSLISDNKKIINSLEINFDSRINVNFKALNYISEKLSLPRISQSITKTIYRENEQNWKNDIESIVENISTWLGLPSFEDIFSWNFEKKENGTTNKFSNKAIIYLFDKSDESILNDYEDISKDENILKNFSTLIDNFITKNPINIEKNIEELWDNFNTPEKLTFRSPVPVNDEQKQILLALKNPDCNLLTIEWPPGTGKSHTITAIICQALLNNKNILVLSDKTDALDVVESKLIDTFTKIRGKRSFPNPILRFGKKSANFGKILRPEFAGQIDVFHKAQWKISTIQGNRVSLISKTQNSINQTIEYFEDISTEDIQFFFENEEKYSHFEGLENHSKEAEHIFILIGNLKDTENIELLQIPTSAHTQDNIFALKNIIKTATEISKVEKESLWEIEQLKSEEERLRNIYSSDKFVEDKRSEEKRLLEPILNNDFISQQEHIRDEKIREIEANNFVANKREEEKTLLEPIKNNDFIQQEIIKRDTKIKQIHDDAFVSKKLQEQENLLSKLTYDSDIENIKKKTETQIRDLENDSYYHNKDEEQERLIANIENNNFIQNKEDELKRKIEIITNQSFIDSKEQEILNLQNREIFEKTELQNTISRHNTEVAEIFKDISRENAEQQYESFKDEKNAILNLLPKFQEVIEENQNIDIFTINEFSTLSHLYSSGNEISSILAVLWNDFYIPKIIQKTSQSFNPSNASKILRENIENLKSCKEEYEESLYSIKKKYNTYKKCFADIFDFIGDNTIFYSHLNLFKMMNYENTGSKLEQAKNILENLKTEWAGLMGFTFKWKTLDEGKKNLQNIFYNLKSENFKEDIEKFLDILHILTFIENKISEYNISYKEVFEYLLENQDSTKILEQIQSEQSELDSKYQKEEKKIFSKISTILSYKSDTILDDVFIEEIEEFIHFCDQISHNYENQFLSIFKGLQSEKYNILSLKKFSENIQAIKNESIAIPRLAERSISQIQFISRAIEKYENFLEKEKHISNLKEKNQINSEQISGEIIALRNIIQDHKNKTDAQIAEITEKIHREIDDFKTESNNKIEGIKNKIQEQKDNYRNKLYERIERLRSESEAQILELETKRDSEIANIKEKTQNAIDVHNQKQEEALNTIYNDFNTRTEDFRIKQEQQITEIQNRIQNEIEAYNLQKEEALKNIHEDFNARTSQFRTKQEHDIWEIRTRIQSEIDEYISTQNSKFYIEQERIHKKIEDIRTKLKKKTHTDYDKIIQNLKNIIFLQHNIPSIEEWIETALEITKRFSEVLEFIEKLPKNEQLQMLIKKSKSFTKYLNLDINAPIVKNFEILNKCSIEDIRSYKSFIEIKNSLENKFWNIPEDNYSTLRKDIENNATQEMIFKLDEKFIEYKRQRANDITRLRKLISSGKKIPWELFSDLRNAFPCILAGIRDYADYIPMDKWIFDIIIIDEASQVSIAQALPALIRGKQIVILGDQKQFSNVKSNQARKERNIEYQNDLEYTFKQYHLKWKSDEYGWLEKVRNFDIKKSILDFAQSLHNYPCQLKKHFRSYPELISYSNKYFYANSLQCMKVRWKEITDVIKFKTLKPLKPEEFEDKTNPDEMHYILKEIFEMKQKWFQWTIGIISPYRDQVKLIQENLKKMAIYPQLESENQIKVMTFDTCQWEERDYIFYSMVANEYKDTLNFIFIKDFWEKLENDVEDMSTKIQRLNVGFSRAKECIHFVISKPLSEFDGEIWNALRHFKNELESVKKSKTTGTDENSPMEKKIQEFFYLTEFYKALHSKIELIPQFEIGRYLQQLDPSYEHPFYKVDFLLIYEGKPRIIIEYDGFEEHFHNREWVTEYNFEQYMSSDDVYRQKVLEWYGYQFLRINKFNIGKDPIKTLSDRIVKMLFNGKMPSIDEIQDDYEDDIDEDYDDLYEDKKSDEKETHFPEIIIHTNTPSISSSNNYPKNITPTHTIKASTKETELNTSRKTDTERQENRNIISEKPQTTQQVHEDKQDNYYKNIFNNNPSLGNNKYDTIKQEVILKNPNSSEIEQKEKTIELYKKIVKNELISDSDYIINQNKTAIKFDDIFQKVNQVNPYAAQIQKINKTTELLGLAKFWQTLQEKDYLIDDYRKYF